MPSMSIIYCNVIVVYPISIEMGNKIKDLLSAVRTALDISRVYEQVSRALKLEN